MALTLGLPNQVPVPADLSDDLNAEFEKSPSKRHRGAGAGVKMPAPASSVVTLEAIQQLLSQQSATLMEAQRLTISQLEARQDQKMQKLEAKVDKHFETTTKVGADLRALEERLSRVEQRGGHGVSAPAEPRKLTLVFGGWPKQTRRHIVLHQLSEAVQKLDIRHLFDSEPFTTGPRRSVALCGFKVRDGETQSETRSRMLNVISTVNIARAQLVGSDRTLWCSFSRTPEERGRAALPGFIKKVVMQHKPTAKDDLDIEYRSGISWMGESQLCGLGEPPQGPDVQVVDTRAGAGWIDAAGLASKTGLTVVHIQQMVQEHQF